MSRLDIFLSTAPTRTSSNLSPPPPHRTHGALTKAMYGISLRGEGVSRPHRSKSPVISPITPDRLAWLRSHGVSRAFERRTSSGDFQIRPKVTLSAPRCAAFDEGMASRSDASRLLELNA
jgi:hypothetical protein